MLPRFISTMLVVFLLSLPLLGMSQAQATPTMMIFMGDEQKTNLVAGIIHNVTLALPQSSDDVVLTARLASAFTTGNRTNNYSWSYHFGTWTDDLYSYYLKEESSRQGNSYFFHIAVDAQAVPGSWYFVAIVNGVEASNKTVTVEQPMAGISMSAPTFYFQVIPYGTGYISSWRPEDPSNSSYLSTRNIGNVPLTLTIYFQSMNTFGTSSSFGTTNTTGTYEPGAERVHYVDFQAQTWSPRKFTVKGYVNGEPQLVMTPDTVTTIISAQTTFDVVVTVARPGYDVFQMDGVTVQYKRYYYSSYKESVTMDIYLTGNKSVYLGQHMENLTFKSFFNQGAQTSDDLLLVLSDTVEQQVMANVTCSTNPPWKQPSMLAYAIFDLSLADNSGTGEFTSTVVVLSSGTGGDDDIIPAPSIIIIIILVIVFVVIGVFLFRTYRKTEEERRRELEDRIRKKKENARKQRRR